MRTLKLALVYLMKATGLAVERRYGMPSQVGFEGWVETRGGHVVAFREYDGSLLVVW